MGWFETAKKAVQESNQTDNYQDFTIGGQHTQSREDYERKQKESK